MHVLKQTEEFFCACFSGLAIVYTYRELQPFYEKNVHVMKYLKGCHEYVLTAV